MYLGGLLRIKKYMILMLNNLEIIFLQILEETEIVSY